MRVAVALCSVASASCGVARFVTPQRPEASPVPEAKDVAMRLFLIGDAGVPLEKDPVLASLAREVDADAARSVVVYLGDNIYPRGLPAEGTVWRKEAERRLDAQIEAVREEGARAFFIPGNHDWDKHSAAGWETVRRQGQYIDEKGGGSVSMEPKDGCPGPVVRDFDRTLRLVLLDTQWWLHAGPKPRDPDSSCPADSEKEVVTQLAAALKEADGRPVVVAGHHPLATGGSHGGYFSWQDHLFPLRARKSWLWIPLPVIGSLYPAARRGGASAQDISGTANRKMREALEGAFKDNPPLVYAAGHEHNLQVLKGGEAKYLIVSGAGAYGHVTQTVWTKETLFAAAASGYVRVDLEKTGRARLAVVTVAADGKTTEAMALDLTTGESTQEKPPPGTPETPQAPPRPEGHGTGAPPPERSGADEPPPDTR
jgi:hypothetical protein